MTDRRAFLAAMPGLAALALFRKVPVAPKPLIYPGRLGSNWIDGGMVQGPRPFGLFRLRTDHFGRGPGAS